MNVVFLDIDGVLNSEQFALRREREHLAKHAGASCDCTDRGGFFLLHENNIDHEAVSHLNALLQRTGAMVVVSSTWRKLLDIFEIERILMKHGFVGDILSWTPHDRESDYNVARRGHRIERGDEIAEWIVRWNRSHPDSVVRRFVILDDGSDMGSLGHRLILTDPLCGLTANDVKLATAIMESQ